MLITEEKPAEFAALGSPLITTTRSILKTRDMDFHLSWILGYVTCGGAQYSGSALALPRATMVTQQSWVAWRHMAQHMEAIYVESGRRASNQRCPRSILARLYLLPCIPGVPSAYDAGFLVVGRYARSCFRDGVGPLRATYLACRECHLRARYCQAISCNDAHAPIHTHHDPGGGEQCLAEEDYSSGPGTWEAARL